MHSKCDYLEFQISGTEMGEEKEEREYKIKEKNVKEKKQKIIEGNITNRYMHTPLQSLMNSSLKWKR